MDEIPVFGCDLNHSFASKEELKFPLKPRWKSKKLGTKYFAKQAVTDGKCIYHIFGLYAKKIKDSKSGLCAHDIKTGEKLWEFLFDGYVNTNRIVCDGGKVYYSENGYLSCVDGKDGKIIWRKNLEGLGHNVDLLVLHEGILYVNLFKAMTAIDSRNGGILWCLDHDNVGYPSLYKNRLYYGSSDNSINYLNCFDLAAHKSVWRAEVSEYGSYSSYAHMGESVECHGGVHGVIAIHNNKAFVNLGNSIASFDTESGEPQWQTSGYFNTSPACDGRRLYTFRSEKVATDLCADCFTIMNAESGEIIYQALPLPPEKYSSFGREGSLLTANGIFISGGNNRIFAYSTADGELLWEFWNKKARGSFGSQPILYGGLLYVVDGSSYLYCFEHGQPRKPKEVKTISTTSKIALGKRVRAIIEPFERENMEEENKRGGYGSTSAEYMPMMIDMFASELLDEIVRLEPGIDIISDEKIVQHYKDYTKWLRLHEE